MLYAAKYTDHDWWKFRKLLSEMPDLDAESLTNGSKVSAQVLQRI